MAFKKRFYKPALYVGLRDKYLVTYCKNKKVLHVGCTDWPFAEISFRNGSLLHANLEKTSEVIGLDIDVVGLKLLSEIMPGEYISGNLIEESCRDLILKYEFDIILIPDVIEHVPNQFDFINGLLKIQESSGAEILITTPNVYALKSFLAATVGLDFTHTDHRLFHNESTLRTSLQIDFKRSPSSISFSYASRQIKQRYGKFLSFISRVIDGFFHLKPHLADTIIVRIHPLQPKKD